MFKKKRRESEDLLKMKIVTSPESDIPEEKCSGCRLCELTCSLIHTMESNPSRARIHVVNKGHGLYVPNICVHCDEPVCIEHCPTGAIRVDNNRIVIIDKTKCNGCGICIQECPYEAIFKDTEDGLAIICDLCGGDPLCFKYCTAGVLKLVE